MNNAENFAAMWMLWESKGHEPLSKIKIIESPQGFVVGILDYITQGQYCLLSQEAFDSYEKALASIGRAVDAALKKYKLK